MRGLISLRGTMSTRTRKNRQPDAKVIEALRAWLASPQGQKRMRQVATEAEKARANIEKVARVPSEILRARVTL
jgi:hypothetical protein